MTNKFTFDIFAGTFPEDDKTIGENNFPQDSSLNSQPKPKKEFRPKTPSSLKIKNGQRGKIIQKLKAELENQLKLINPNFNNNNVIKNESPQETDLNGIDPEIQKILNDLGIFFFKQIPSEVIILYGNLLSNKGSSEDLQLLEENALLNNGNSVQYPLKSQKILLK
jgi:hypothetical protein